MKFWFTIAILVASVAAFCQEVTYGLKGGLNLSDIAVSHYINPDAEAKYKMKAGPHAGFFVTVEIADDFLLSSELLYSCKGVKAVDRINLHYINLPLLVQYKLTDKFLVEGGPELGYLFSARSRYGNVGNTWNNKLDLGLDVGLKYNFSDAMAAGVRYSFGFSSVINSVDDGGSNYIPAEEKVMYQNRVLQFSVYWTLGRQLVF
jgi:hypothetical protein